MRIVETKVFKFYELSKEAQEKAFEDWLGYAQYPYYDDYNESMKKFIEMLNGKIQVSSVTSYVSYNSYFDEEVENLSGVRLAKYLWNNFGEEIFRPEHYYGNYNPGRKIKVLKSKIHYKYECPLTGCYTDHSLLDPMVEFMRKPIVGVTMLELLDDCFGTFVREIKNSVDDWFCMEVFNDECEVNDWEFYANGDRYYA